MSEVTREIAALKACIADLQAQVEALASRLQAVGATLERAERAAIRREERWSAAS